jgi:hypothetical protein
MALMIGSQTRGGCATEGDTVMNAMLMLRRHHVTVAANISSAADMDTAA